jgi:hypothetical protein
MKNILSAVLFFALTLTLTAQDFDKNLSTARTAYGSGKLEDARFAMQQMMNDIDVIIGKEVIKLLPAKLEALNANTKNDNVTANTGLAGVVIHRDYSSGERTSNLDIMSNSPMIGSLNAILSLPFVGNSGDGTQKVVKVQGYKGVLQKALDTETNKSDFTLQIPLNNTLLTLVVNDSNEAEILKMANAIPIPQIVKLVQ